MEVNSQFNMMKIKTKNYIKFWLPLFIWAIVIFSFSSYQTPTASEIRWQDFIVKKTFHLIEYAILTTLSYRALKESGVDKKKAGIYSIIITLLYGASDEFHQTFTIGRDGKVRDVIIDTAGALLAIYGIWNLLPKAPKKLKSWAERLQII